MHDMYDARLDHLARVLVRYSVAVRKNDVVRLKVPIVAEPLLVALCKQVLLAGAHPVIRPTSQTCMEMLLRHGKREQLEYLFPLEVTEIQTVDVHIGVWADENTRAFSGLDPKRQAVLSKTMEPVRNVLLKRAAQTTPDGLRWVGTQYPCPASAQDAEMSLSEYADFVFQAGLLHTDNPVAQWKKISTSQQRVVDFLDRAREVHVVAPGGTDIRFGVEGRRWVNCDGRNNFPDGEVFTGPIESATEGEVRFTFPAVYGGREVTDVFLRFRAGKVVEASAGKGEDFLLSMLDQDKGARVLGELAFGTNYAINRFTRNTLFDEKIGGTFHMALGAAYPETGGKNKSAMHWDMVCDLRRGGRVEVDGREIARSGRFVKPSWPQPARARTRRK